MKKNLIFRLDKYIYFYHDNEDDENVEERYVLGYFTSKENLQKAIKICEQNEINKKELKVHEFLLSYTRRRKYIYELSYEYTILNEKHQYIDYSYIFPPQISKDLCIQEMKLLLKEEKYKPTNNKIFDSATSNGFWIEKLQLNKLYNVIPIND